MSLAVILDMDGLMLDTERISWEIWRGCAVDLGCPMSDEISEQMIGLNARASRALLLGHFGEAFPVDALYELAQVRYREHLDTHGVPTKPGLEEFLQFLDRRRLPRAVATSTVSNLARRKLEQAGVLRYFDVIVGGDEVQHGKPAPDIFLEAASRLGAEPAMCVVLEDSGPGIRGAAAAGMFPILIPDVRPPTDATRQTARAVVASLSAACHVIDELIAERAASAVTS